MKPNICVVLVLILSCAPLARPQSPGTQNADQETLSLLLRRIADDESRIKALESMIAGLSGRPTPASVPTEAFTPKAPEPAAPLLTAAMPEPTSADHDHMMEIPNGPTLHFRGFFDLNYDVGSVAQNLQYPLGVRANNSFRTGEFDLFMTSQLSPKLSFVAEMVVSTDPTNAFAIDLERYQFTYRQNKYLQISAGRYHSAIGYYNTAYHHGVWFSTATGRPFMYYFEDSGGPLPVHELGVTSTGAVPGSGKLDLHWVAEIGNGRADAGSLFGDGVESFASDRNRKDINFALYSRPEWLPGLQVGGSWLNGDMVPIGMPKVIQTVSSLYAVYITPKWEFLNEAVLLRHQLSGGGRSYSSPMGYTQLAYHVNKYVPYFRFQEVNIPTNDPVAPFTGRYEGPSFGLRYDVFDYAALKFQYNRVYLRTGLPQNGFETQLAFTF